MAVVRWKLIHLTACAALLSPRLGAQRAKLVLSQSWCASSNQKVLAATMTPRACSIAMTHRRPVRRCGPFDVYIGTNEMHLAGPVRRCTGASGLMCEVHTHAMLASHLSGLATPWTAPNIMAQAVVAQRHTKEDAVVFARHRLARVGHPTSVKPVAHHIWMSLRHLLPIVTCIEPQAVLAGCSSGRVTRPVFNGKLLTSFMLTAVVGCVSNACRVGA